MSSTQKHISITTLLYRRLEQCSLLTIAFHTSWHLSPLHIRVYLKSVSVNACREDGGFFNTSTILTSQTYTSNERLVYDVNLGLNINTLLLTQSYGTSEFTEKSKCQSLFTDQSYITHILCTLLSRNKGTFCGTICITRFSRE